MTHKCENKMEDGHGVVMLAPVWGQSSPTFQWMCFPCWEFLTKGNGQYSQLARNAEAAAKEKLTNQMLSSLKDD